MILGKEEIINKDDLLTEEVPVEEWGGSILLRTMTATERDAYEASVFKGQGKSDFNNLRSKLLSKCIVDEKGKRLFKDSEIDALGAKSANVIDRLYDKALDMNGMKAKNAEELIKNLKSDQNGDSASGSPAS
jgi:hypothetical protein